MSTDSKRPLDGVDPASVEPGDVDESTVREALSSTNPLVRQDGVDVCGSLASADAAAVEPFLDTVAALADDDNAAIALRAIDALKTVAATEPDALAGRLDGLAGAADSDIVDVQLTAATVLGKLVVDRPDLVASYAGRLAVAVRTTELDEKRENFGEFVQDPATRQTLEEHTEAERKRRVSARRTLANVVVAVTEQVPDAALDAVDELVALLDDTDPGVAGAAVDALGELAAADPAAVAPVRDRLSACLDHDRTFVRVRAVRALGRLGDDAVVPRLRALAEDDDDEDVRELAADTADYLADA